MFSDMILSQMAGALEKRFDIKCQCLVSFAAA